MQVWNVANVAKVGLRETLAAVPYKTHGWTMQGVVYFVLIFAPNAVALEHHVAERTQVRELLGESLKICNLFAAHHCRMRW